MSTEPNIRNRVAGAVVLVSLAVIFLPLILDGQKKNQILESYIPEKPKTGEIILVNVEENLQATEQKNTKDGTTTVTSKKPVESRTIPVTDITNSDSRTTSKPEAEPAQEQIKPPEPIKERQSRPIFNQAGFVIQVGSFGSRDNASKLVTLLLDAGYKAYFKSGKAAGKTIYRVFTGPYLKRSEADSVIPGLKSLADVKPIVVTYDPVKHAQG